MLSFVLLRHQREVRRRASLSMSVHKTVHRWQDKQDEHC
jgi:hypothetical protein